MGLMAGLHPAFHPSEPAPNLPQPLNLLAEEAAQSSASACPLLSSLQADLPRKPFVTVTSLGQACFQKKGKKMAFQPFHPPSSRSFWPCRGLWSQRNQFLAYLPQRQCRWAVLGWPLAQRAVKYFSALLNCPDQSHELMENK